MAAKSANLEEAIMSLNKMPYRFSAPERGCASSRFLLERV